MRIVVLGTGALGCVFAARLSATAAAVGSRAEVWMLGTWAEGIAAVQRDGVCLREGPLSEGGGRGGAGREGGAPDLRGFGNGRSRHAGRALRARVRATTEPAEVPPADVALLLVKSYQTARAAAWASRVLLPAGLAVTLQNGLDNAPILAAAVGANRAAAGVTYNGAILLGPGEACQTAHLPTVIGVTPSTERAVAPLVEVMNAAGLKTGTTADIEALLWGKALANAAINPLTAIWRVPNGGPLESPGRRRLLAALVEEVAAVARAKGIRLGHDDPAGYVEGICRATAINRSSMLQDVERGRPTEIDGINGVIVTEGRRLGVPTPVNDVVWQLVRGFN